MFQEYAHSKRQRTAEERTAVLVEGLNVDPEDPCLGGRGHLV